MATIRNTQNIDSIEMKDIKIIAFCPMGNDNYNATIDIYFEPNELIMDYIDIKNFIDSLAGKSLIIEDVVDKIFEFLFVNYEPKYLEVSVLGESAVHYPARVTKVTK